MAAGIDGFSTARAMLEALDRRTPGGSADPPGYD
jgi:hypothetical protein